MLVATIALTGATRQQPQAAAAAVQQRAQPWQRASSSHARRTLNPEPRTCRAVVPAPAAAAGGAP